MKIPTPCIVLAALLATSVLACTSNPGSRPPGSDRDAHGCIGSAGYSWCERDKTCVRPGELGQAGVFAWGGDMTANQTAFDNYCEAK